MEEEGKMIPTQPVTNTKPKKSIVAVYDETMRTANVSKIDTNLNESREQLLDKEELGEINCYSNRPQTGHI